MDSQKVDIRKLMNVLVKLADESCNIIKQYFENQNFNKFYKGGAQVTTEADLKIQHIIMKGVRMFFPNLNIVGEQSKQYTGQVKFNFDSLSQDFFDNLVSLKQELPCEELCLWIDPIDATSSFVNGNVQFATVLIGLSYKQRAHAGVIGSPYKKIEGSRIFTPTVCFGSSGVQQCYLYQGISKKLSRLQKPKYKAGQQIKVMIQDIQHIKKHEQFLNDLRAQSIWLRGVGTKGLSIATGQSSLYIFRSAWLAFWDTCAPEAIIKSLGGHFKTLKKEAIIYDSKIQSSTVGTGFVASMHQELVQRGLQILK